MKRVGIVFVLFLVSQCLFAQSVNTEELKLEIKNLKHQLQAEQEKTTYLKEALDLRNDKIEVTEDSVTIKLIEVKGNSTDNSILVKGLVTYNGLTKAKLQFGGVQRIVDPKGNTVESFNIVKPNNLDKSFFIDDADTDIPYAFVVKFDEVERTPNLSLLSLQIYETGPYTRTVSFKFRGLDVVWE